MSKFIGFTNGLMATRNATTILVMAEINRVAQGFKLTAKSARNMANIPGCKSVILSKEQYDALPEDNLDRSIECLKLLGWEVYA